MAAAPDARGGRYGAAPQPDPGSRSSRIGAGPWVLLAAMVLTGCAGPEPVERPEMGAPSTVSIAPSAPAAQPTAPTAPTARPSGTGAPPTRFAASIRPLDPATRRRMAGNSWRPGCPTGMAELRLVALTYRDFAGRIRRGRLVVHRDVAAPVVRVFRALFRARYPIRRMRLVDRYGGSDMRSITANNTSAFNCRRVPGSGTWSEHAYGRAVDINPVQNPYWRPDGYVEPVRGRRFLERNRRHPAMIREGDAVVRAFDGIGWHWGGRWRSLKDWQHFSATGR